jgi:hypothetical protein
MASSTVLPMVTVESLDEERLLEALRAIEREFRATGGRRKERLVLGYWRGGGRRWQGEKTRQQIFRHLSPDMMEWNAKRPTLKGEAESGERYPWMTGPLRDG